MWVCVWVTEKERERDMCLINARFCHQNASETDEDIQSEISSVICKMHLLKME